jgi:DNA-binding beta-propeller fold protein YncE
MMNRVRFRMIAGAMAAGLLLGAVSPPAEALPIFSGDLYYTTFSGGQNVWHTTVTYDRGTSAYAIGAQTAIASTPGADGIIFAPDGDLLVGGQNAQSPPRVYKVNKTNGTFTSASTGSTGAYHLSLTPDGTKILVGGELGDAPGTLGVMPVFGDGTTLTLTGDNRLLTQVVFDNAGNAYYTASGAGGTGDFGTISIDFGAGTAVTTRTLSGIPAAHGIQFDPFTGDLFLVGSNHISQIDPGNLTALKSDRVFAGLGSFDQAAVDGNGNIYAANNDGHLAFVDYSATGLIGDGSDFTNVTFLHASLDDIAPLVGPGSNPVPEPLSVAMSIAGLTGLGGYVRRRSPATT